MDEPMDDMVEPDSTQSSEASKKPTLLRPGSMGNFVYDCRTNVFLSTYFLIAKSSQGEYVTVQLLYSSSV